MYRARLRFICWMGAKLPGKNSNTYLSEIMVTLSLSLLSVLYEDPHVNLED